jgi:hypothetical protein
MTSGAHISQISGVAGCSPGWRPHRGPDEVSHGSSNRIPTTTRSGCRPTSARRAETSTCHIRESRRIQAQYTIAEQDLSLAVRGNRGAVSYPDSVGIGMYRIDLHPSTGGDSYLDIGASPFQIPLGALLPRRLTNLIAASKNIGSTHITNGCYRLHPVEWNVGEAAGLLAAYCLSSAKSPSQVRSRMDDLRTFQQLLVANGIELAWPRVTGY